MAIRKPGTIIVTQMHGKEVLRRDFDAEEWGYTWVKLGEVEVLRLEHDADPAATAFFDYVEFSTPVVVEFEYEG